MFASSWKKSVRNNTDAPQDEGTSATPMGLGSIECYKCEKKGVESDIARHARRQEEKKKQHKCQGLRRQMTWLVSEASLQFMWMKRHCRS